MDAETIGPVPIQRLPTQFAWRTTGVRCAGRGETATAQAITDGPAWTIAIGRTGIVADVATAPAVAGQIFARPGCCGGAISVRETSIVKTAGGQNAIGRCVRGTGIAGDTMSHPPQSSVFKEVSPRYARLPVLQCDPGAETKATPPIPPAALAPGAPAFPLPSVPPWAVPRRSPPAPS